MKLNVLLIEPFYSGSHQKWVDGFQANSHHHIDLLTLPGRHWKWRMHGGAVTLAEKYNDLQKKYDVIIASDMLDLTTFRALIHKHLKGTRLGVYFHENQLTYPWSPNDEDVVLKRDQHYAFINYVTALSADFCWFNSGYHKSSFLNHLPHFLSQFPDFTSPSSIDDIRSKSSVLNLGMDLSPLLEKPKNLYQGPPTLLWNHRWEYDKQPEAFFEACHMLKQKGVPFHLIVCGEQNKMHPLCFDQARQAFHSHIIHWGYVDSSDQYQQLLARADISLVTSIQDFFGGSVIESIAAGCLPYLPRRLAYPEHVPKNLHPQFLYTDITTVINEVARGGWREKSIHIPALRNHTSKYNWLNTITRYDEEIVRIHHHSTR